MKLLQFIGLMVFCFLFQSYNAYASVQVNSVTPRIIKLESNKVVTLSLRGRGLNAIKGAALHRDKGARQTVSGLVGKFSGSATSGKLMLTFRGTARSGNYYVHVTDGRKAIALLPVSVKVAAASVAKRPTMRRNPILERKRPAVARKAIARAATRVTSVMPRMVQLTAGHSILISLRGSGLNAIKGAALHRDKGARQAVSGLVGKFSGTATSGKLMLTFRGKARSGNYYVHVTDGRKAIALLPIRVNVAAASVAKRPTMRRNPVLERKRPALARKAIARAVTRVTSAMPRTVQLTAGHSISISLRGSGLNAIKGAALHRDKGARQAVSGLVGKFSGSATSGKLMLTFRGKARSGNYYVHVTDGRKAIALLPVSVKVAGASVAKRPVQARNGLANVRKLVTPQKTALTQRKAANVRKNALALAQRKAADARKKRLISRPKVVAKRAKSASKPAVDRKALLASQTATKKAADRKTLLARQATAKQAVAKKGTQTKTKPLVKVKSQIATGSTQFIKRNTVKKSSSAASSTVIKDDETNVQYAKSRLPSRINDAAKNINLTKQQALQGSGVDLGGVPNEHNLPRIKITSFLINNGAAETASRTVNLQVIATNGPIKAYRICETVGDQSSQGCNIRQQPWIPYRSNLTYTLQTPTRSINSKDKTLYIQLKGNPLPSPTIRNVTVDNFSTLMPTSIKHLESPELTVTPRIKPRFRTAHYNFSVKGISADTLSVSLDHTIGGGGCQFELDNIGQGVDVTRIGEDSFNISIITAGGPEHDDASSCFASLRISALNKKGEQLAYHSLRYNQDFEPYKSRTIRVDDTYQLLSKLHVKKQTLLLADQGWTICEGNSVGTSGIKKIGVVNEGGDLVIKTRSSPVGRTCEYSLSADLKRGWLVTMNFSEVRDGSGCVVSHTGEPKHVSTLVFSFTRGKKYIGWEREMNIFKGSRVLNRMPSNDYSSYEQPTVFLTCSPSISNNHGVKSVLSSVEFEMPPNAPDNATWQDAFN